MLRAAPRWREQTILLLRAQRMSQFAERVELSITTPRTSPNEGLSDEYAGDGRHPQLKEMITDNANLEYVMLSLLVYVTSNCTACLYCGEMRKAANACKIKWA